MRLSSASNTPQRSPEGEGSAAVGEAPEGLDLGAAEPVGESTPVSSRTFSSEPLPRKGGGASSSCSLLAGVSFAGESGRTW